MTHSRHILTLLIIVAAHLVQPVLGQDDRRCVEAPAGLTAWWPGDGNVRDVIGRRHAVLNGMARFAPGVVGEAFSLAGDGDFVSVPDHPGLDVGTAAFTVDLWVRFDSTEDEQVLIEKYVETFDTRRTGWTLTKLSGNSIRLAITADAVIDSAPQILPLATWIHFAVRRSGSAFTVLRDGVPIAQGNSSANLDTPASLKFGHRGNSEDTPGSTDDRDFFLRGAIDEVELFVGRALSDQEIAALVAASGAGRCKPRRAPAPAMSQIALISLALLLAVFGAFRATPRAPRGDV